MPRRYRPDKREVEPDLKYNNQVVQRLINRMMHSGKKSTAQRVLYKAFDRMP
jgi:small subunit ribosomal protein S7